VWVNLSKNIAQTGSLSYMLPMGDCSNNCVCSRLLVYGVFAQGYWSTVNGSRLEQKKLKNN